METAALLDLPNAFWCTDFYLRERDWGQLGQLSNEQIFEKFASEIERKKLNSFFWAPPGGESLANVCLRVDRVLGLLQKECPDKRVVVVGHGEVMWAFRVRLERISQSRYQQMDKSGSTFDRLHQCHVLHYTRRDPETGKLHPHINWFRSVCPWNLSLSTNEWQRIHRGYYSNEALMQKVEKIPIIPLKPELEPQHDTLQPDIGHTKMLPPPPTGKKRKLEPQGENEEKTKEEDQGDQEIKAKNKPNKKTRRANLQQVEEAKKRLQASHLPSCDLLHNYFEYPKDAFHNF